MLLTNDLSLIDSIQNIFTGPFILHDEFLYDDFGLGEVIIMQKVVTLFTLFQVETTGEECLLAIADRVGMRHRTNRTNLSVIMPERLGKVCLGGECRLSRIMIEPAGFLHGFEVEIGRPICEFQIQQVIKLWVFLLLPFFIVLERIKHPTIRDRYVVEFHFARRCYRRL